MKNSKYRVLYEKLKADILSGVYPPLSKLPSKRTLADINGVSIITVENSYSMLYEEGYIFSVERKGYFVSDFNAEVFSAKNSKSHCLKLLDEPQPKGKINVDFEYSLWAKTVRKVLNEKSDRLFIKPPVMGCEVLRNAISEYLLRYRGMFAPPERIVIGSGAEQLYETAIQIIGRDKTVGIENPCYKTIITVYEGLGINYIPLEMGKDGIKTKELKSKNFDVLHITPFHSFPSGISTSMVKRNIYLDWAKTNGRYIIEDDYDSEFFLKGRPMDTLYSLNRNNSVIYINTFSKSLSPSLRMGYMIIPENLMGEYTKRFSGFSCSVPVLEQYVLGEFISSGNFERHLNRMRRKIRGN